jgi:hypothetical protein
MRKHDIDLAWLCFVEKAPHVLDLPENERELLRVVFEAGYLASVEDALHGAFGTRFLTLGSLKALVRSAI